MENPDRQRTLLAPGAISLWPQAFTLESAALMQRLCDEASFSRHTVRIFGRELPAPRLSAWHGEAGCSYRYSGVRHAPLPLGPAMQEIRARVESLCGQRFNCVLLNLYRDGHDSMGWHSDDEKELDQAAPIASVSFGGERKFAFKHKLDKISASLTLENGSVLLMQAPTQQYWQHSLTKTKRLVAPRINLTFRAIRHDHG